LRCNILVMALATAFAAPLAGDEPLPKPERKVYRSPSGNFLAVSDPTTRVTTVFAAADRRRALWTLPGWHGVVYISDDGALIVGYYGSNLLARDYLPSEALLSFYHGSAKPVKVVAIQDLVGPKDLRATVSHYSWGAFLGIDKGRFLLEVNGGRRIAFNPATGERVNPR